MRIRSYLTIQQATLLFNAYIMSSFNYCPLVWMFCSKQAHNIINKTHHKALCAKLNTFDFTLEELISKTNTSTIHIKNLRLLVIEVFKSLNRINPKFMWNSFKQKENSYNLRQGTTVLVLKAKSTDTLNSFNFRGSLAWNHLPAKLKLVKNLPEFSSSLMAYHIYCKCRGCT